jgi:hypothetical protein
VIDSYATKHDHYTTSEFLRGVTLLLAAVVGVAFVSRVAKNVLFQTLVGILFVTIYAFSVHWVIAPVYFATVARRTIRARGAHHPDRTPALDDPARGLHLCPRARPDRRAGPARRAPRRQGPLLRHVAPAGR